MQENQTLENNRKIQNKGYALKTSPHKVIE